MTQLTVRSRLDRLAAARRAAQAAASTSSALKKPGWFDEGDELDFSSTSF